MGRPLPLGQNGNPYYPESDCDSGVGQVGQNFPHPPCFMDSLNILAWNARGAASADFRRVFRELMMKYRSNVVLLIETRIGGPKG